MLPVSVLPKLRTIDAEFWPGAERVSVDAGRDGQPAPRGVIDGAVEHPDRVAVAAATYGHDVRPGRECCGVAPQGRPVTSVMATPIPSRPKYRRDFGPPSAWLRNCNLSLS
jgi:hypothetical protein